MAVPVISGLFHRVSERRRKTRQKPAGITRWLRCGGMPRNSCSTTAPAAVAACGLEPADQKCLLLRGVRGASALAADPVERTHRFRIKAGRRQHPHEAIVRHQLDMTHITGRKGSPQTLVCTKTRRRYERRLAQYQADLAAFTTLAQTAPAAGWGEDPLVAVLKAAAVPH